MQVVVLVYDGVMSREALTLLRPFRDIGASCEFQSKGGGPCDAFDPYERIATVPLVPCAPDLLVVPGGFGWRKLAADVEVTAWLARVARAATRVLAVSTGAALLEFLGLTDQRPVAGHWLSVPVPTGPASSDLLEPVIDTGWLVSAAGAISGLRAATDLVDQMRSGSLVSQR